MALTQISTAGVKDDAVTAGKIPANAVGSVEIAANAVGSSELADNAVDTAAIADDAVTAAKIADGTVTATQMADNSSPTRTIQNSAVTTIKIADGNVTAAKLASGVQTTINNNADNRVITGSGTANTLNGESNVVIDSSGNCGIGTTSPTSYDSSVDNLVVQGSGNTGITVATTNTGSNTAIVFADGTGDADSKFRGAVQYLHNGDVLRLLTASAERMRIDSSGRVGIGTNDPSQFHSSADDLVIQQNGHAGITIDSTSSHNSSVFFADGATGGEAYAGYIQYSHSNNELRLGAATNDRVQIRQNEVEIVDGDLIIGTAGHGIQFDVNGSGNDQLLDDYEEGTFDPTLSCTSGSIDFHSSYNTAAYTKIGNVVYCTGQLITTNVSSPSGNLDLVGLPFAGANLSDLGERSYSICLCYFNGSGKPSGKNHIQFVVRMDGQGATQCRLEGIGAYEDGSIADWVGNGTDFWFNFWYKTDA